jgi:hypothetical protein
MFIVSGSPQVVRRSTSAVRRAPGDLIKACIQVHGRATVHQDDREVVLDPGQLAVYDTGRPYALRLEGTWRCVVVALPRETLALPAGTLAEAMRRAYPAGDGPGLVLSEFVSATVERVGQMSLAAAGRLGEAATSLLAGTLADDGDQAADPASSGSTSATRRPRPDRIKRTGAVDVFETSREVPGGASRILARHRLHADRAGTDRPPP